MYKSLLLLLILGVFATSCISNKELIYLQGEQGESPAISAVNEKPYRVHVHDVLSITIKASEKELTEIFQTQNTPQTALNSEQAIYFQGFIVDDHGNVRLPILNEVNVLGFTIDEVRQMIEKRLLEEYFTDQANLFVTVKLGGFRYTTNGEVVSPGAKLLYQDRVTILEAIANSGDITITGDRKNVMIIRRTESGTEMHTLDLTQRDVIKSPYFYLQPNDYVYVKPLPQKAWGTGATGMQTLTTVITILSLVTSVTLILTRL